MTLSSKIEIACAADDLYVPHLAAALHSVRCHARDSQLRVNFLWERNLSARNDRRLSVLCHDLQIELRRVDVPRELMRGLNGQGYISRAVWYRIYMPRLLPDLERVLYLDADIIAMQSIAPLWQTQLDAQLFAAVVNVVPKEYSGRAKALGLPGAEKYFNAGIALWNLTQMRSEGFEKQVTDFVASHADELLWLEQDALNALFHDRWQALHPKWNCQNGIFRNAWGAQLLPDEQVREALAQPALLHFEGGEYAKPWHFLCNHPLRQLYSFHRKQTPWSRWLPTGLTAKRLAKRILVPLR